MKFLKKIVKPAFRNVVCIVHTYSTYSTYSTYELRGFGLRYHYSINQGEFKLKRERERVFCLAFKPQKKKDKKRQRQMTDGIEQQVIKIFTVKELKTKGRPESKRLYRRLKRKKERSEKKTTLTMSGTN